MVLGIFKIALHLTDWHAFMWQSLKVLNDFLNFLKNANPFESTKIDNISFPYKTALSEANVKTNRMGSTKWTYHKEW